MLIPFDKYYPGIIKDNRERMKRSAEIVLKVLKSKHQKEAEKEDACKKLVESNDSKPTAD